MSDRRLSCQHTSEVATDHPSPQIVVERDTIDPVCSALSRQRDCPSQSQTVFDINTRTINRNNIACLTTPITGNNAPLQHVPPCVDELGALGRVEGDHENSKQLRTEKPAAPLSVLAELTVDHVPSNVGIGGGGGEENVSAASMDNAKLGKGEVDLAASQSFSAHSGVPAPPAQLPSRPRRGAKRRGRRDPTVDSNSSGMGCVCTKIIVRFFKKTVWPQLYSPSVSSLAGFMSAISVFVAIAIMLGTVGILASPVASSTSKSRGSSGSGSSIASSPQWEHSANGKLRAVSVEALKPLEDAIRGLDEVQQFAMQRRETELVLDVIGTGGHGELKHTQPSRIYAPTADASALLPLGPFVSKLSSNLLSTLHSSQAGGIANNTGYTGPTSSNTVTSILVNLPQVSLGFEDGRYVHVGAVFRSQYDLAVSALDGVVGANALSGDYNGSFPLLNKSLDNTAEDTEVPIINATPPDVGNANRSQRYYSYGSWKIATDEGTAQAQAGSTGTMWLRRPYAVDAGNMSTVYTNQLSAYVLSKRRLWLDVAFARDSPWYTSARGGTAPLQKSLFGLYGLGDVSSDPNGFALTISAPVYIRRTSLSNTTGDPADPVGGHQRSQVTYSSPEAGSEIESFINDRYAFVGVASSHLMLRGLSDHLASVVDSVWPVTAPKGQLFLLRHDIVWATSLRKEDGTRKPVTYTIGAPTEFVDQEGVSLCTSTGTFGDYTCMHSIGTFYDDRLSRAYATLPEIASPPTLHSPTPANAVNDAAGRVREFMQSSSKTQLFLRKNTGVASTAFTDSEGSAWDVSYAVVSQPSIGLRPFSDPQTAPFVLVLISPADPLATCKEVIGLHMGLLIGVGAAILVVVAVVMMTLSRVVLSPLRSIATLMSLSAHLIDNSTNGSAADEEVKQKLADRTLSHWAEVSAIQQAYWSMTEELQFLAAYIPEHLRDEVLVKRTTTSVRRRERSPTRGKTAKVRQQALRGLESSVINCAEFSSVSLACERGAETSPHQDQDPTISPPSECSEGINVLKGPPRASKPRLTKAALQSSDTESSKKEIKASPRSQSAGSELSVGGKGLAAHSIVSLGVVFEKLEGDTTEGSVYTSGSTAGASTSPGVLSRPVFFIDSALIDREITVVHFNIIHFHLYAGTTHGTEIARQYEAFISFVHQEARRHGGMLESFSGDKIWVSFNASSKCDNGPVAAAYYAHTVTSAVNNEVICKGASKAKAFRHPIFTSERRLTREFKVAPYGITCGVATGRAFVGPLGNASVKRHTIISNAMSEAAVLERQALRYPGCNALMGGDMIPAVEGYCQYVLVDASLLPGSDNKRRRVACIKGPMAESSKHRVVVAKLLLTEYNLPVTNPYRTVNEAMNAFLEGQTDVCHLLLDKVEEERAAAVTEKTWDAEERAACKRMVARFIATKLSQNIDGRTHRSEIGESHALTAHALCLYTFVFDKAENDRTVHTNTTHN